MTYRQLQRLPRSVPVHLTPGGAHHLPFLRHSCGTKQKQQQWSHYYIGTKTNDATINLLQWDPHNLGTQRVYITFSAAFNRADQHLSNGLEHFILVRRRSIGKTACTNKTKVLISKRSHRDKDIMQKLQELQKLQEWSSQVLHVTW